MHDHRSLRLAGLLGTAIALSLLWVAAAFMPRDVPFAPSSLADAIIRATPGAISTFFIDLLQGGAIKLLAVGVMIATLALGSFGLAWTARGGRPRPWATGVALALLAALAIVVGPGNDEDPLRMVVVLGAAGAAYALTAGWISGRTRGSDPESFDIERRNALRLGIGSAVAIAAGGGALGWFAKRFSGPDTDVALAAPAVEASIGPRDAFPDIPGLTPEVTTAGDHYVVDINFVQPSVSVDGWSLKVTGLVESPLEVDFFELQRRFPIVEEYSVLSCISNEVGGDLVGHSLWGGIRLADLLQAAGVRDGAVDVVLHADDGYTDSIPLATAMHPSVLVAISQNREPLTQEHGFPCRLRVPMIYGMKNVKWLREIEVVDHDYRGYWMQRGWSDEAIVRTQSRIDVAGDERRAKVGVPTWIAGVAWAGGRGIAKVEVSLDGGRTWAEAMLKDPIGPHSWRQWAFRWEPDRRGTFDVACRATDGEGAVQTSEEAPPHPAGATGWHHVSVKVG
ncbi:MAG: molybdopterin-dependent oxidoreductase [Actinomycetota bacterium]